jgi:hypothetical protein
VNDRGEQENMEQIVGLARGQRGEQGEQGPRGPAGLRGLPIGQARAIVYLFVINLLLIGVGYAFIASAENSYQAGQQREQRRQEQAQRREQAAARRTGEIVEQRICLTMHKLAALTPPAGNPARNPSRAFDDELHATLDQLGPDIGCR